MNTINFKNAQPGTLIIWQYLASLLNPVTIIPFVYLGQIAGSEFLTYANNKMYFGLELDFTGYGGAQSTAAVITLHDKDNVAVAYLSKNSALYNTTASDLRYSPVPFQGFNYYFSRILTTFYTDIRFIGYKITY